MKALDRKLRELRSNPGSNEFILADAKDADMAFGVRATGKRDYLSRLGARPAQFSPEVWEREEFGYRNLPEFLDIIREVVSQGLVDIVLMSAYVNEILTIQEKLFENSPVTPAARANDTTDVWAIRNGAYVGEPAQTFRSASIDHIQCGAAECDRTGDDFPGANLGLYSITYLNDLERDRIALNAFKEFREEAERKRFRYFLEIFDPNVGREMDPRQLGEYINDAIIRTLAGVTEAGRPQFLKIVYHGPRFLEELVQYDPNMIVGILGGSAGTTYDAFKLLADAKKHGARVALYGRKINQAEHQLAFIQMLRFIVEDKVGPEEAVRAYHGVLEKKGIRPHRALEDDLCLTHQAMAYDESSGNRRSISTPTGNAAVKTPQRLKKEVSTKKAENPTRKGALEKPDFSRMTREERNAYDRERLKRRFG